MAVGLASTVPIPLHTQGKPSIRKWNRLTTLLPVIQPLYGYEDRFLFRLQIDNPGTYQLYLYVARTESGNTINPTQYPLTVTVVQPGQQGLSARSRP
jgi:hypothetical protein